MQAVEHSTIQRRGHANGEIQWEGGRQSRLLTPSNSVALHPHATPCPTVDIPALNSQCMPAGRTIIHLAVQWRSLHKLHCCIQLTGVLSSWNDYYRVIDIKNTIDTKIVKLPTNMRMHIHSKMI
jgi:hypothetical protein